MLDLLICLAKHLPTDEGLVSSMYLQATKS